MEEKIRFTTSLRQIYRQVASTCWKLLARESSPIDFHIVDPHLLFWEALHSSLGRAVFQPPNVSVGGSTAVIIIRN